MSIIVPPMIFASPSVRPLCGLGPPVIQVTQDRLTPFIMTSRNNQVYLQNANPNKKTKMKSRHISFSSRRSDSEVWVKSHAFDPIYIVLPLVSIPSKMVENFAQSALSRSESVLQYRCQIIHFGNFERFSPYLSGFCHRPRSIRVYPSPLTPLFGTNVSCRFPFTDACFLTQQNLKFTQV